MKLSGSFLIVLAAAVFFIASASLFTVNEREHAIKLRFSEIVREDYTAGLHWKIPFVNTVRKFPRRVLTIQNPQELFLTEEKKNLFVDFYIKYRIVNVGQFYRSSQGDVLVSSQRLLEIVKDGIRAEFAKRTVPEVVSAERREIMAEMLNRARASAEQLGLEVIDVRVKRIEFSDEVSDSVYRRMREERSRVASELRAEGAEDAERIRADADRRRTVILADAYRQSQVIRGEGDAVATDIYARAFGQDRDFYSFYRSLEAYRNSLGTGKDLLVLDSDNEFLRFLNQADGR